MLGLFGVLRALFWLQYFLQDIEMHRGKPLYLNEERYAAITYMVCFTAPFFHSFSLIS